jgi:hypothetical protein
MGDPTQLGHGRIVQFRDGAARQLIYDKSLRRSGGDHLPMDRWESEQSAESDGSPVARIVYASQASVSHSIYAELEKIRASALKHNEPAGIATALLYQSGWFVQWKEGPGPQLLKLMHRVAGDGRHHDLRVVHRSRGPRLLNGPWSMAVVQCRETAADMEERVRLLKLQVDEGRQFAPPAIWRRLSTPMEHPGAMHQDDPDGFQRVLVCSAAGTGSFDLVNWLGEHYGTEVVRRRFAGAHDLDVGTNYVDFHQGGRVLRVIAMARHGLSVPLTRAFMADYSHFVLLLSLDADRNLQLMERVLSAYSTMQQPPLLVGIASQPEMHMLPHTLARRFHLPYQLAVADSREWASSWRALEPLLAGWQQAANSSGMEGAWRAAIGQ